jgi:hypothetical protein
VGIDVADGPAAAVEINERRQLFLGHRPIGAHRVALESQQAHFGQDGRLRRERGAGIAIDPAGDQGGDGVILGQRRAGNALEQHGNLRVKAHGRLDYS